METLIEIKSSADIPQVYIDTPIGRLLEYHNLGREQISYPNAELLVGMCMDNRKSLNIPENFAFVIRAGGANLRPSEFKVSFALSIGKVQHIALIGHNNCGMVNLKSKRDEFIIGLIENAGWTREDAEAHFEEHHAESEINNEIEFITSEVNRLRQRHPKIKVAPMLYRVEDNKLYLIKE